MRKLLPPHIRSAPPSEREARELSFPTLLKIISASKTTLLRCGTQVASYQRLIVIRMTVNVRGQSSKLKSKCFTPRGKIFASAKRFSRNNLAAKISRRERFAAKSFIPIRLRVLSHSYFSPYLGRISVEFPSFFLVFLCILCVLSPFGTVLVSKFGINFLKNRRRKNPLFFLSN